MHIDTSYQLIHQFTAYLGSRKPLPTVTLIALSILSGIAILYYQILSSRDQKLVQGVAHSLETGILDDSEEDKILAKTKAVHLKSTQKQSQRTAKSSSNILFEKLPPESQKKVERVKVKNGEQVKKFEIWAAEEKWITFTPRYSHYDWWAFPITRPSRGKGDKYAVNEDEIAVLKADPEFMDQYRRGVDLVVKSWGWDLRKNARIPQEIKHPSQRWTGYEVRLGKMADSLRLFGEKDLYQRLQHFFDEVCLPLAERDAKRYHLSPWVCELFDRPCPEKEESKSQKSR